MPDTVMSMVPRAFTLKALLAQLYRDRGLNLDERCLVFEEAMAAVEECPTLEGFLFLVQARTKVCDAALGGIDERLLALIRAHPALVSRPALCSMVDRLSERVLIRSELLKFAREFP